MVKKARKEEGKSDRYAVTTNNLQAETGRRDEQGGARTYARVKDGMEMRGDGKVYRTRTRSGGFVFSRFNFSDCYLLRRRTHPSTRSPSPCPSIIFFYFLLFIFFACTVSPTPLLPLFPVCLITIQPERETLQH